jgi:hypothetical protein
MLLCSLCVHCTIACLRRARTPSQVYHLHRGILLLFAGFSDHAKGRTKDLKITYLFNGVEHQHTLSEYVLSFLCCTAVSYCLARYEPLELICMHRSHVEPTLACQPKILNLTGTAVADGLQSLTESRDAAGDVSRMANLLQRYAPEFRFHRVDRLCLSPLFLALRSLCGLLPFFHLSNSAASLSSLFDVLPLQNEAYFPASVDWYTKLVRALPLLVSALLSLVR